MTRVAHVVPALSGGVVAAVAGLRAIGADDVVHVSCDGADDAPTLVHCHHALAWDDALAAGERWRVPVAKTVHMLQRRQSRMRELAVATRSEAMQARALAEADALTIATHAAKAMLLEDHPELSAERVRVVPLAGSLPRVDRIEGARADGPVVAVTRFDHLKGTDLLIEVVARALRAPSRRIVIAGGLPHNARGDAKWRAAFRAAVDLQAGADANARLTFVGWLAPDALARLLATARLFVTTSRLETCGLALLEALAAGCPAVATDLPVHREVAGDATRYAAATTEALGDALEAELAGPLRLVTAPREAAGVAQEWLSFWRQTR